LPLNKRYLLGCISISLLLVMMQIRGSSILILACMAAFLALLGWSCVRNYTLPVLLYFLPWSLLMRTSPKSFSFFTLGLVLVCGISVVKKRFRFKRYHIISGILLVLLTLFSKLLHGSFISFDYIAFIMLIVLLPVIKEEYQAEQYDFFHSLLYFSLGIILAALLAQRYIHYGNIARYISMHSYSSIIRMFGFNSDPNFYTAQVTAALGGCFYAILEEKSKRRTTVLGILLVVLMYCGVFSGSKSFVLVSAVMVFLWTVEMMRMRGKTGRKVVLILAAILVALYIASSALFGGWIQIILTRFSFTRDLSSLTTGRTELWKMYIEAILKDWKILFFGQGFTNVKIRDRSSHNTLLQFVYQLGILGTPILLAWIACFFRGATKNQGKKRKWNLKTWILLTGVFVPWLAIDAMFFDEFFLLQWYVFSALQSKTDSGACLEPGRAEIMGARTRRLRVTWKT